MQHLRLRGLHGVIGVETLIRMYLHGVSVSLKGSEHCHHLIWCIKGREECSYSNPTIYQATHLGFANEHVHHYLLCEDEKQNTRKKVQCVE